MGKLAPVPLLDTRRALVALGGVIAAVAGALAGMGTPQVDLPLLEDVPGGSLAAPSLPSPLEGEGNPAPDRREGAGAPSPAGNRHGRRQAEEVLSGIRGWIFGPTGPLQSVPVELVPFLRAGEPRRAGIQILSGPGGEFTFRNMGIRPADWALLVHAPGFGIRAFALGPSISRRPARILLDYGKWITGKALSSRGSPVALGRVWAGLPLEGAPSGRILWRPLGRTSREGRFVVRDLPPERKAYILVDHPLFAPSRPLQVFPTKGGSLAPLKVSLVEGRRLEGRVLSREGRPKPKVYLFWEGDRNGGLLVRRGTTTDQEGRFVIQGLPWNPPPLHLWVAAPGGRPRRVDLGKGTGRAGEPLTLRLAW